MVPGDMTQLGVIRYSLLVNSLKGMKSILYLTYHRIIKWGCYRILTAINK